jgi:hypothetical protein
MACSHKSYRDIPQYTKAHELQSVSGSQMAIGAQACNERQQIMKMNSIYMYKSFVFEKLECNRGYGRKNIFAGAMGYHQAGETQKEIGVRVQLLKIQHIPTNFPRMLNFRQM